MNRTNTSHMSKHTLLSGLAAIGLVTLGMSAFGQGLVNSNAKISIAASTFLVVDNGGFSNNGVGGEVINAGTFEVDGTWENNSATNVFGATPTAATGGTVILDGGAQSISGTNRTHFYNVTAAGSARKVLSVGAAGAEAARVFNVVTLTTGIDLNARSLRLENGLPTAISGAGVLVAENDPPNSGYLNWNIGNTNTGNYTIPFANSTGTSIPLVYNISNAGTPSASPDAIKRFSTYPTQDNNLSLVTSSMPPSVTHLHDDYGNDNTAKVIDRFWIVDNDAQGNYSTYPNILLSFGYAAADLVGNTITAPAQNNLVAQRFNNIENRWHDWLYGAPSGTPNVHTINLTRIEDYFPVWTLVDQSDPLPIELARFVGQCKDGGVEISWTTYTETNNDFFTLERSKNGVDFEVVDVIAGAGNSNSPITYKVLDLESYGGTSYYRLKNTDTYGKEEYSQVIAVTCGTELTDFTFINAYEIDNTDLLVEFTASENERYTVTLFDASGRIVYNHNSKAMDGMNKVRLPVGNLAHGIYIINLQNDTRRFSRKVLMK
jgi:hypothetical protein